MSTKYHEHVWRHESVILGSKAYYSSWCVKCNRTDYEIARDERQEVECAESPEGRGK